jgi:hypothetical protein
MYGALNIGLPNKKITVFNTEGDPSGDIAPGLKECSGNICLDDLEPYLKAVREAITAHVKPDETYDIISTLTEPISLSDANTA